MLILTGGAGFIGSALLATLEQRPEEVVVVDTLGHSEKWRNLAKRRAHTLLPPHDLAKFIEQHQKEITAIIHLGAISATTATDVDAILDNNYRLSIALYEWCAKHEKRFLYASSAATYGSGAQGFKDGYELSHLRKLRPLNAYGWSKNMFDIWVSQKLEQQAPVPPQLVGWKFFNVFGPNEYHKGGQRSVMHQMFEVANKGEAFALFKSDHADYPDGGQKRDFVWVQDVVDVILWHLDNPKVKGLFNVGTGKAASFFDAAKAVYESLYRAVMVTYKDMPAELRGKYQYFTEADMSALKKAGYTKPMTATTEAIRRYVQDYLATEDHYI